MSHGVIGVIGVMSHELASLSAIWEPFGGHLGAIWESFGSHLEVIWEPFGGSFGASFGSRFCHPGDPPKSQFVPVPRRAVLVVFKLKNRAPKTEQIPISSSSSLDPESSPESPPYARG